MRHKKFILKILNNLLTDYEDLVFFTKRSIETYKIPECKVFAKQRYETYRNRVTAIKQCIHLIEELLWK